MAKGPKALAYEGKTVTIEKKGTNYEFTAGGKKLSPFESSALNIEFGRTAKKDAKMQDLLPKSAVKVSESWTVGPTAIEGLLTGVPFGIANSKSAATGKLIRAYTQDGKQWGVIEFSFDLIVDPKSGKGTNDGELNGTIRVSGTLDAVVDGSSPDGTIKMTVRVDVTGKEPGKEARVTADATRTKTVKSVK